MRSVRPPSAGRRRWVPFLRHHAAEIWACDCFQITDLFFRPLFAFFLIDRKIAARNPRMRLIFSRFLGLPTPPTSYAIGLGADVSASLQLVDLKVLFRASCAD